MAIRKVEGVESVEVSLERASARIVLRPQNRVTLPQLRQIIKDNGFTSKDATVIVIGTLVDRGGKPALSVTGTDTVWLLTSPGTQNDAYLDAVQRIKTRQTAPVEVVGTLQPPPNPQQLEELTVQALRPVPE